jgi:hypothetical protein
MADNSVLQKTVRLIRVFVASPGDVGEERSRAATVIARVSPGAGKMILCRALGDRRRISTPASTKRPW